MNTLTALAVWMLAQNPTAPPEKPPFSSLAQEITISGEVRIRGESRNPLGYANGVQRSNDQDLMNIRIRLNLDIQVREKLRAFIQIQDQRFAGDEPLGPPGSGGPLLPFSPTFGDAENTDLHQGYLEIQDCWGEDLDIKLGRWNMCYGSRRMLCNFDYHPVGNAWDGIHAHYKKDAFWVDGWYAFVQERNAPVQAGPSIEDSDHDVDFWGFYSQYRLDANNVVEAFLFGRRAAYHNPPAGQVPMHDLTFGTRFAGNHAGFDYEAEVALQKGKTRPLGLASLDRDALGFAVLVGYQFEAPWSPRVALEYTYGSGDKDASDGKDQSFSPVYPGAHIYNGYADQIAWRNLRAIKLIVEARPCDDLSLELAYFTFRSDQVEDAWFNFLQSVIIPGDASGNADSDLGWEVDLAGRYTYDKRLKFWGGIAYFKPGGFADDTTGTQRRMTWMFLQTTLDF